MESLLAALESFFDEWQQHPILLVRAVKEGADMTLCAKQGAGEPDRLVALTRGSSANLGIIIGGIHRVLLSFLSNQAVLRVTLILGSLWPTDFMSRRPPQQATRTRMSYRDHHSVRHVAACRDSQQWSDRSRAPCPGRRAWSCRTRPRAGQSS